MSLILHRGATEIDYDALRSVPTPDPTHSHVPLPHHQLVDMVKYALGYHGHEVEEEHHGVTEDGSRYFGVLSLKSDYGGYADTVGLRNSHDKSFPIGIAFGSRVFICDNLAFMGDRVIKRKHTANSRRELPGLVAEVIEPLALERQRQHECFARYAGTELSAERADHAILSMFRQGVIGIQKVPEVMGQWENPTHDWGERTAWRLFNAATFTLAGKVAEAPQLTRNLHEVIDGVCERIAA